MNTTSPITLEFLALARKAQLSAVVAMAFEMHPQLNTKGFKVSAYARTVALDSLDSVSEKTATNYASAAKALCLKYGAKIDALAFTADNVVMFASFVSSELANAGYTSAVDDMQAYCAGNPSMKAKRDAAAQAEAQAREQQAQAQAAKDAATKTAAEAQAEAAAKQAQDAQAAAEQAQAQADAAKAEAAKQATEKAESDKRNAQLVREAEAKAQAAEAETAALKAAQEAEAETARKQRESVAIEVHVNAQGDPVIALAPNMSPDFLTTVIDFLICERAAILASLPVAPVKAKAKREQRKAA